MTAPEKSNCICDTPLTWETLEKDLQKSLNTTAKFGDNREAKQIGVGAGYVAKIVLATFDWVDGEEHLPKQLVLKITGNDRLAGFCDSVFKKDYDQMKLQVSQIHNTEMSFYEMVKNDWKVDWADIKVPKYYCGSKFGNAEDDFGYIAIEYFPDAVPRHFYNNVDPDAVCEVLKAYAKLQAKASKHPEALKCFSTNTKDEFAKTLRNAEDIRKGMPALVELLPDMAPIVEKIMPKLDLITNPETFDSVLKTCYPVSFCHGDFWTANLIWTQDENSKFHFERFIDWQMCHIGSTATDLAQFLSSSTDSKTKKENLSRFMHTYYDTLVTELGDQKPPFTYDQLVESYERVVPLLNIPFLPYMISISQLMLADLEGEARETAEEVVFEKIRGGIYYAVELLEKIEIGSS